MGDELKRAAPDALAQTRTRLIDSNDTLVMLELRGMLLQQQRQALIIDELSKLVGTLSAGTVATINEVETLRRSVAELQAQQRVFEEKQERIAALCDRLTESLSHLTEP